MSYGGQSPLIDFSRGGFNYSPNIDSVAPVMLMEPSRNITLINKVREPRGGSDIVDTGYGGSRQMGFIDWILEDGTQFKVVLTADGKLWKNTTDTIKTGLTVNSFPSFVVWNDTLLMANGADIPQVWTGTGNTTDLTNVPTDWSANTTWPTQLILHGREASERVWALGADGFPKNLYGSDLNDGLSEPDFSDANVLLFLAHTNDGVGLTGGIEFGDRLIVGGKDKFFRLDDSDIDTTNWFLTAVQWQGGVAHFRLLVETPNDVIAFSEHGDIYSVAATDKFGDYEVGSLIRPSKLDRWIRDFIDLTKIENFHAVYDESRRAVTYFMTKKGSSQNNIAISYLIDRANEFGLMEAWEPPSENPDNASGFDASCSGVVKTGTGSFKLYTGDYSGNTWQLNTANKNDNDTAFDATFDTPSIPDVLGGVAASRFKKKYRRGWVTAEPLGLFDLDISIIIDYLFQETVTVSPRSTGAVLDEFILDVDFLGGDEVVDTPFDSKYVGKRISFRVSNSNVDESFKLISMGYDRKILGAPPQ